MDKQIYSALMDKYRETHEQNVRIEQARKEKVYAEHPDVAQLATARHQMILESIKSTFQGTPDAAGTQERMETYNAKIRALLKKYGYPEDYLSPVYTCEVCRDTGLTGDKIKTECACFRRAYITALSRRTDAEQSDKTFQNFDLNRFPDAPLPGQDVTQRAYMKVIRRKCEEYAEAYPEGNIKNLLLHGKSGLGKSYLLFCIAERLHARGREALYVTAYQLLSDLRDACFHQDVRDAQVYEETELLLIDDLGMEPLFNNVTVELFFNLLNQRAMRGLGTVVSTNLSRTELQGRYTERFTSRLLDARACLDLPFYGEDIRLIKEP